MCCRDVRIRRNEFIRIIRRNRHRPVINRCSSRVRITSSRVRSVRGVRVGRIFDTVVLLVSYVLFVVYVVVVVFVLISM